MNKRIEKEFKERSDEITKLMRNRSLTKKDLAILYVDTKRVLHKIVKDLNKRVRVVIK